MAVAYKRAHDLLVSAIGTPDKYHPEWREIARDATKLVVDSGFDSNGLVVPTMIRAKVKRGANEVAALRAGANAPVTETGSSAEASKKRVLALKTLRHLYYHESFGEQRIWILSLPENLLGFPMEFVRGDQTLVDEALSTYGEKFDESTRKILSEAAQTALTWVQKAMMVAGSPFQPENRKLLVRWFLPAKDAGEDIKVQAVATLLMRALPQIAAGLKTGAIIITDAPHERGTNSDLENSGAFVFRQDDLMVIYVEKSFFGPGDVLSGRVFWARILVHELSHLYAKTRDYSYAWQGLLPRDTDMLKTGNDAAVAMDRRFKAVRTLTAGECIQNADSWALFAADCAGQLSERDRLQALGNDLYEAVYVKMDAPLADSMRARAGMK